MYICIKIVKNSKEKNVTSGTKGVDKRMQHCSKPSLPKHLVNKALSTQLKMKKTRIWELQRESRNTQQNSRATTEPVKPFGN